VGGTLTGRGGDIIILDDPIKPEDAMSDTVRNQVNEWYRSTLASRLNDKANGAIILVMQRLHEDDLAGRLLETGDWHQLCLPAIAVADAMIPLTRGRMHKRREGDVLHPERESYADLMAMKASQGSMLFAAQYQQQPVPPEGNIVHSGWLKRYTTADLPEGGEVIQSWDTANKDGIFNDYSVCITARVQSNHIYLLNVWRKKVQFPDLRKAAVAQAQAYRATVMLIEDQASGEQLLQELRKYPTAGVPAPIGRRPESDKVTRLAGVSAMIEAGQLYLPEEAPWLADFEHELLAFPASRHFDQVDALSQLLAWVRIRHDIGTSNVAPIMYWTDEDGGSIDRLRATAPGNDDR
jgi:predicted phage terminase large subunit-like protein